MIHLIAQIAAYTALSLFGLVVFLAVFADRVPPVKKWARTVPETKVQRSNRRAVSDRVRLAAARKSWETFRDRQELETAIRDMIGEVRQGDPRG